MYVPEHFKEDRVPVLHDAIRQYSFGTLVTVGEQELEAGHLPMLLDSENGPLGMLLGHMARANRQWQRAKSDVQALAIFLGPHAYVTPSWYPTTQQTGKAVPTWNYLAIHAYGDISFYDDTTALRDHVGKLTAAHESARAAPWSISDAPADYIEQMLGGIVGFRLVITRLEGKWKMSQNRSEQDISGVREGLAGQDSEVHALVAAIMAGRTPT